MKKVLVGLIIGLFIWITILLQINFFNGVPLVGVLPNAGIVLVAGLGLVSGRLIGGISGFVYGLWMDLFLSRTIGVHILLYTLLGSLAGAFNKNFSKENKLSMVMLILLSTILFETVSYVFSLFLHASQFEWWFFISTIILESVYNILLTLLFFRPITGLGELIYKCKKSYYLL